MKEISNESLKKTLSSSDHRVYITCVGEEGYPNVTVRKVKLVEDTKIEYSDNANSRTVQLMMKSPKVVVTVINTDDPFHGYKIKGNASFHQIEEHDNTNKVMKISITLSDGFLY
ncbi:pyridoxamine 5'-phosphate oxidase family protein [Neobacillus rhizophilus]|uniref:Pyridoxamine 5'-phosphate oxidase family protein n=1 Tax=Neobacillus rhizophilus TaxID=2833579 RepID=A0A942UA35_9BACI|nr:pyridoxamine 5'-phosphate oxidase family protein [Neobacillus rhizophilus]MBS4215171.1 pyridoxamine 5'-phosphate oxidase family protein [Neobacillus rhizophilus]